ncbi:MAG: cell division protein ZipA [Gammaproteobacteria bacterium]|nr:cell division protein ZipA [Gammaproteobacteria bacterium]
MENLRWILILAGFAILALLYFSGRQPRSRGHRKSDVQNDPLMGDLNQSVDPAGMSADDYAMGDMPNTDALQSFADVDPDDFVRPAGGPQPSQMDPLIDPNLESAISAPVKTGITGKIEAFSEKLSPRRRQRVAETESKEARAAEQAAYASKIVTLHVVAPDQQVFGGAELYDQFEQRGYHFGDMNIFHSLHQGKTVFSIAKIVEPGYFDIEDIDSFQTPGISLILQLPGPVAADVAFEVLISEAWDLAQGLGGSVLDSDHSTLSNQAVQHMREGIFEYMHRQKYFSGVPS